MPLEPRGFSIWLGSLFWENGLISIEDHIEDLKLATATFSPPQPLPFLGPEPHLHRVVQYEENIFASSFEARLHSKVQHDHLPNVEVSFSEVRGTGRGLRSWFPYNMRACHCRRVSKARTGGLKRL